MNRDCLRALIFVFLLALLPPAFAGAEEGPVRIAFIDSGISTKHIDGSRVLPGRNYVFPDSDTQDRIGHGTATAGLVLGAPDQGIPGVCPGALAVPLVVVDTYPSGTVKNGGTEALCRAIYDAVDEFRCGIINISLCTNDDSPELRRAADYAERRGVLVTAAAGNGGRAGAPYYPAACGTVVSVGSFDKAGAAEFSQDGVSVLADGVGLLSATNRNSDDPVSVTGTSYSCAVVTGLCARSLTAHPDAGPLSVRIALYEAAEDLLAPGFDTRSGWGRIRADAELPVGGPAFRTVRGILREAEEKGGRECVALREIGRTILSALDARAEGTEPDGFAESRCRALTRALWERAETVRRS